MLNSLHTCQLGTCADMLCWINGSLILLFEASWRLHPKLLQSGQPVTCCHESGFCFKYLCMKRHRESEYILSTHLFNKTADQATCYNQFFMKASYASLGFQVLISATSQYRPKILLIGCFSKHLWDCYLVWQRMATIMARLRAPTKHTLSK